MVENGQGLNEMEDKLKDELKTNKLENLGSISGGWINEALAYDTDHGKIFVKINHKPQAKRMFEGEFESLVAINKTGTIKTPQPYKVIDHPEVGSILIMEYLELTDKLSTSSCELGRQLASLHLHNSQLKETEKKRESFVGKQDGVKYVEQFGFKLPTCCGYLPQSNVWCSDWLRFYCEKIETQIGMAESECDEKLKEVRELWNTVLPCLPRLFTGLEIQPALLHGDLHSGNSSESNHGPVIYDPASFYGHAEYDLAIAHIYGGYCPEFFYGYHEVIPKAEGFQHRLEFYKLFHYLNHWNHYSGEYPTSPVSVLKSLILATK